MTDAPDDYAQIIELRPGQDATDDGRPLVTGPRSVPFCQHHRCRLDTESRRVYGRECDREVPAFDRLLSHSRSWERFIEHRREAERRMTVTRENLAELLAAEKRAKARLRNAAKREPEVERHLRSVVKAWRLSLRPTRAGEVPRPKPEALLAAMEFLAGDEAALDHGMLDWRAERSDDPEKPHEEICGSCREPWPCTVVRLDWEARSIIAAAKGACRRCGKHASWR